VFDQPTTMPPSTAIGVFFNVDRLSFRSCRLETADGAMLIATAMSARATGKTGRPSITVLDECWFLLDSPALAPEVVQLYRTARKRNSSVVGYQPGSRRLRGHGVSAAGPRSRHPEKRQHEDQSGNSRET